MTTMNDSREVEFGKAKALFNVSHDTGEVTILGAFIDGTYGDFTIAEADVAKWAAYGLRAYAKSLGLDSGAGFTAKVNASTDPFARAPRSSNGPAATPLETALVQATGKTLEQVREFLVGKSRKELAALKSNPRVAPIYAAEQAAVLAAKAAKKAPADAPQVDLLAGLDDAPASE